VIPQYVDLGLNILRVRLSMTKGELLELMKDLPDDAEVKANCWFNRRDPAGFYKINAGDVYEDFVGRKAIVLDVDDD